MVYYLQLKKEVSQSDSPSEFGIESSEAETLFGRQKGAAGVHQGPELSEGMKDNTAESCIGGWSLSAAGGTGSQIDPCKSPQRCHVGNQHTVSW